ncbi:MAG: hypothetical protein ABFD84_16910 [Candidatus Polarisedimenticolia bacterium]|nr:hypothetical protein [bacterium]
MTLGEALRVFMSGPDEDEREAAAALVLEVAQHMARAVFHDDAAADEAAARLVARLLVLPPLEDGSDAAARAYIKTALTRSACDRWNDEAGLVSLDEELPVSDDGKTKRRVVLEEPVPEWHPLDEARARQWLDAAREVVVRRVVPDAVDGSPMLRETWAWIEAIGDGRASRERIVAGLAASMNPSAKRAAQNRFAQRVSRLFRALDRRVADLSADEGWTREEYEAARAVLGDLRERARI